MSFFKELKRRNVIRVAIAYAIVGWLLVEVASVVLPTLLLPDWTLRILVFFVILGFPLALIFAWAFELTPEGLKREHEVDRSESITHVTGRKLDFMIIGVMAVAIAYFLVDKFVWVGEEPASTVAVSEERPSIAVLPFANRSANEDDAFFVDGIHDDLLSHISKIGSIKTISRTSVLQFRDTTKTIPQIAKELGVTTVLEGGVQRAGEHVRINVQLIDAQTDEHLWSETYDRQLSAANIFAIQTEVATAIAGALQATLSPKEQDSLKAVPTENLAALEAYFLGKQRMAKRNSVALAESADYFQHAIELDPDFALAYVGLADSYLLQHTLSGLPKDEMLAKVEPAIDKALELNDQLGEAYTSLGLLKSLTLNLESAEEAFERAIDQTPNYATAHQWYAALLRDLGRNEEALAETRKAQELDPLALVLNNNLAYALGTVGRFNESLAQYRKGIEIDPAFFGAYFGIGTTYELVFGRLDEAVAWYKKSIALNPGIPRIPAILGLVYLELGDIMQANYWINRSLELGPEDATAMPANVLLHLYRHEKSETLENAYKLLTIFPTDGDALTALRNLDLLAGRYTKARARYEKAFPTLVNEHESKIDGTNYRAAIDLALVLSKTGEQQRADLLLDRSLTFIQTLPRLGTAGHRIADVQIYAQQGKTEKALAALREAIDEGWRRLWWYHAEHDPNLDSIRNELEFQAMMEEIEADVAEQLTRVHEWEANGELVPTPKSSE